MRFLLEEREGSAERQQQRGGRRGAAAGVAAAGARIVIRVLEAELLPGKSGGAALR